VRCIRAARLAGLEVPRQLSVVGIDDIEMSAHITPALTTVMIPTARIGQLCAATLLAEIKGERRHEQTELPIELVVRQSTATGR
jgi:LacI family transcriptional regulator